MRRETMYVPKEDAFNASSSEDEASFGSDTQRSESEINLGRMPSMDHQGSIEIHTSKMRIFVKYIKIIGPHIGLVALLVCYLLIGATIFHYIEVPNEIKTKEKELRTIFTLRDNFHENIWNLTHSADTVFNRESFNIVGQEYFEKLVELIFDAYRNQFIDQRHLLNKTEGNDMLWTFANSVFFATTVVTTIGYGHLVPATDVGRLTCIVFALFGIPLLLVTIADIGKFLSDFLSYLHREYCQLKKKLRKQSRRISYHRSRSTSRSHSQHSQQSYHQSDSSSPIKGGSMVLNDMSESEEQESEEELRIPVVMVLLVLVAYTAIGGLLFQAWEGWRYFDAFYFCFITMATVGFGDIVPTKQVYLFFTMAYIIFGLSLATMCIDLAGTEYIRRIHDLGNRVEDAKGVMVTGADLIKHTGIEVIRNAGGKLIRVRGKLAREHQLKEGDYVLVPANSQFKKNILYEPPSNAVQKLLSNTHVKILPDEIDQSEGFIVQNRNCNDRPILKQMRTQRVHPNKIYTIVVPVQPKSANESSFVVPIVPFVLKESHI